MAAKKYSSKKREESVRHWMRLLRVRVALAAGWQALADDARRQRDLRSAAEAARRLAEELERAASELPRQEWTMQVGGGRSVHTRYAGYVDTARERWLDRE